MLFFDYLCNIRAAAASGFATQKLTHDVTRMIHVLNNRIGKPGKRLGPWGFETLSFLSAVENALFTVNRNDRLEWLDQAETYLQRLQLMRDTIRWDRR